MTSPDTGMLRAVAALFHMIARTFSSEIDRQFYQVLVSLAAASPEDEAGNELLDPHIVAMGDEAAIGELATEYCRLFIGPRAACPPYASFHLGEAHLGGRALRQMTAFLDRNGLGLPDLHELPVLSVDHAAVAFAVYGHLLAMAARRESFPLTPGRATAAARELRDQYLLKWAPQFLRVVRAESRLAPYGPVAGLAVSLLHDDELLAPG